MRGLITFRGSSRHPRALDGFVGDRTLVDARPSVLTSTTLGISSATTPSLS